MLDHSEFYQGKDFKEICRSAEILHMHKSTFVMTKQNWTEKKILFNRSRKKKDLFQLRGG